MLSAKTVAQNPGGSFNPLSSLAHACDFVAFEAVFAFDVFFADV
jgi:hypothetical protein